MTLERAEELIVRVRLNHQPPILVDSEEVKLFPLPPNEQLNLTLYPVARLAYAKPRPSLQRKLTRC